MMLTNIQKDTREYTLKNTLKNVWKDTNQYTCLFWAVASVLAIVGILTIIIFIHMQFAHHDAKMDR